MRKGFLMMTDALLAFLIISSSVVVAHQFLIDKASYERSYLHSVASDAAALVEDSRTENLPEIANQSPTTVCLKVIVNKYQGTTLINERDKVTKKCPEDHVGEEVIARRTFIDDEGFYMIKVRGWYKTP